jgi:hypothetical protein
VQPEPDTPCRDHLVLFSGMFDFDAGLSTRQKDSWGFAFLVTGSYWTNTRLPKKL